MSKRKIEAITAMAGVYRRELSTPSIKIYLSVMAELTDDQFDDAIMGAARKSKFMPSPAELMEVATGGGVSHETQAELAFEELDEALCQNQPSLMPPLVAAVARQIGGFQLLYGMPIAEFKTWKRKDFLAAYVVLVKENPARVAAISGPHSAIGAAMNSEGLIRKIQTRDDVAEIETSNRKKISSLQ